MSNSLRFPKLGIAVLITSSLLTGCWERRTGLSFLGEESHQYYKDVATNIEFPAETQQTPEEVVASAKPRTINDRSQDEVWEMPLSEAIMTALQNNRVVRANASFAQPGNAIFTNPDQVASVYDPAIQESGVLFGRIGTEAALSAFDARWDTRMLWGRNSTYNNIAAAPGTANPLETANFNTSLSKAFGYGGAVTLGHNVDYLGQRPGGVAGPFTPGPLFPSSYRGSFSAEYRQPLLAGAGTEYTRIAGPITQSFGGITGVSQGVVIARINNDLTVADLEANIRNLVLDVESLYWDLYLAYVAYDTAVQARESARVTWNDQLERRNAANLILDDQGAQMIPDDEFLDTGLQLTQAQGLQGNVERPDYIGGEFQARDSYYQARVAVEQALSSIYSLENRFRRLLGLQVNDGRIIRPADEPLTAEFIPDWYDAIADGLTNRVELRRQKWNVKSLELQLTAAKSLTRPRLDFVTSARMNGLGDDLFGTDRGDGITGEGLDNLYGSLVSGNTSGWTAGFEMSIPVGYRSALAQVRNVELRLAKAREVLSVQEMDISHEIANAMQQLALNHQNLKTLYNRRIAAKKFVLHEKKKRAVVGGSPDLLLRAIASRADADLAYYEALVAYNKALADFQFRKGTLLEYNNVYLAEDHWDPAAYEDALRRAQERGHAIKDRFIEAKPAPFSMGPHNPQTIELRTPAEEDKTLPPLPHEEELPPAPAEPESAPPVLEGPQKPEKPEKPEERPYDEAASAAPAEPERKTLSLRPVPDSRLLSRSINRTLNDKVHPALSERARRRAPDVQPVSHESGSTLPELQHSHMTVPGTNASRNSSGLRPESSAEHQPSTPPAAMTSPPSAAPREPLPQWPGVVNREQSQPSKSRLPFPSSTSRPTETEPPEEEWYPLD